MTLGQSALCVLTCYSTTSTVRVGRIWKKRWCRQESLLSVGTSSALGYGVGGRMARDPYQVISQAPVSPGLPFVSQRFPGFHVWAPDCVT